ncbi:MAG: hypothetical protein HZA29_00340 [Candidatus Omnitrophica bacterium]|nr:hypothetical protein [Candidatus Omnitrophota bacterium]
MRRKIRQRNEIYGRRLVLLVCLSIFVTLSSGCASLHKKFVRKKKENKEEQAFIPVLDPVDYPARSVSPEERYRYNYSLWKVWQRDLVQKIDSRGSDKNQKYLVGQIIVQLEEMKKWINDTRKQELSGLIAAWRDVLVLYDQPAALRSSFTVKRKVESAAKDVREKFNPETAKGFLVSPR